MKKLFLRALSLGLVAALLSPPSLAEGYRAILTMTPLEQKAPFAELFTTTALAPSGDVEASPPNAPSITNRATATVNRMAGQAQVNPSPELVLIVATLLAAARSILLTRPPRQTTLSNDTRRRERRPKTMGPRSDMGSLDYDYLRAGFVKGMDIEMTVSLWPTPKPQNGPFPYNYQTMLFNAVRQLGFIVGRLDNGSELQKYLGDLVSRPENTTEIKGVRFRVSKNLEGVTSTRYFNPETGEAEIIFSYEFYRAIMTEGNERVRRWLLLERVFHELGHTNTHGDEEREKQEEHRLILWDVMLLDYLQTHDSKLHRDIEDYFSTVLSFGSGPYFRFLQSLLPLTPEARERAVAAYLAEHMTHPITSRTTKAMGARSTPRRIPSQTSLRSA